MHVDSGFVSVGSVRGDGTSIRLFVSSGWSSRTSLVGDCLVAARQSPASAPHSLLGVREQARNKGRGR